MSTIERNRPSTPNLPPNEPAANGEKHDPNPNNRKSNKKRNILIGAGATAALIASGIGLMVAGGRGEAQGPEVKPPGNEQVVKSPNETLLDNIANRPAEGTPEYNELFAPYSVPYVEGQPIEEVVLSLGQNIIDSLTSGKEDAPKNVVDWQIETGKSANDLADELQLGYYEKGIYSQFAEPEVVDLLMNSVLAVRHKERVANMLIGNYTPIGTVEVSNYDWANRSALDFSVTASLVASKDGLDLGSSSFSARAVDVDGDGSPDKWSMYQADYSRWDISQ